MDLKRLMMTAADQIRPLPRNFRAIPKPIKDCFIILIGTHLLSEVPSLFCEINEKWACQKVNPFLKPGFNGEMELVWYLKFLFMEISDIATFYCFAKIAGFYSNTLFLILVVILGYHIVDLIMYVWDFKTNHYLFFDLLWTAMILIKSTLKPFKPETIARIKSLF